VDTVIEQQQKLCLSPYMVIYDLVIPKDNLLRKINELIDFSFVYDELVNKYCLDNGRNAISPIRMFKYLLLKAIFDLSDVDIVERSKYDMSFKYFLDMAPEDEVIEPSSLTKFRKLRLKDVNLLDMLIGKTVAIAMEKGIIKSKSIILDATHTKARYNQKTPKEILMEISKKLRKSVYEIDEKMKEKFPAKTTTDILVDEREIKSFERDVG
jgi:transposase